MNHSERKSMRKWREFIDLVKSVWRLNRNLVTTHSEVDMMTYVLYNVYVHRERERVRVCYI